MIYHNRSFTYELLESMPTNIKNSSTVAYMNFVTDLLEYVHPHVVYDKSVFIFFKKKVWQEYHHKKLGLQQLHQVDLGRHSLTNPKPASDDTLIWRHLMFANAKGSIAEKWIA